MKEKYITITGMKHYYGLTPFKIGKKVKCEKEPKNPFDSEAIRVTLKHIGTVGCRSDRTGSGRFEHRPPGVFQKTGKCNSTHEGGWLEATAGTGQASAQCIEGRGDIL